MSGSVDFLVGLLDEDEPAVAADDFDGAHATALNLWQKMGFLKREPMVNPVASCPHCHDGAAYRIAERFLCSACHSVVDSRHRFLWPVDREAFLVWLAEQLHLRGGVRRIDERLWQIGTWDADGEIRECFFRRAGLLTEFGRTRLSAFRSAILFYGASRPPELDKLQCLGVSLLEILRLTDSLSVANLRPLLSVRGNVRFDAKSGIVWIGDAVAGEVPVGSKEWAFLRCLALHVDQFVPYADLKHAVLWDTGSKDTTEEATFCHRLKNRIKERGWVLNIDRLLTTTNKGEGYRLRGQIGGRGEL